MQCTNYNGNHNLISLQALKRCRDKESDIRATMLAEIEAFEGYTEKEMKSLNVNAKTESYPPNTVGFM